MSCIIGSRPSNTFCSTSREGIVLPLCIVQLNSTNSQTALFDKMQVLIYCRKIVSGILNEKNIIIIIKVFHTKDFLEQPKMFVLFLKGTM